MSDSSFDHALQQLAIIICMLQVRHLFDTGESREMRIEIENVINTSTPKLARNGLYLYPFFKKKS